jgi:hypothetical protein
VILRRFWNRNRVAAVALRDRLITRRPGHVSRQMLARYSHIRMDAKHKALESIVGKPAITPAPQSAAHPAEDQKPEDARPIQ